MISIHIPKSEYYNEATNEFTEIKETTLKMEHSLISIKKWEAKWNIAFLGRNEKTDEQMLDYLSCMTISPMDVNPIVYKAISNEQMKQVGDYIRAPMTATTFYDADGKKISRETVTAELIYYWMIALNIPMDFQKVHLNQLLTLIRTVSVKNTPPKKMSREEILRRNAKLNAERRKRLNTRG